MEHLSIKLTDYILKKELIHKEDYAIYQYGFQCFLEVALSTVCSIVIALFLHMLPECLFFFLFFIPMRSFSGGLHLNTYFACFIGSCLILVSTLLAVKYFTVPIFISLILYIICAIVILSIGPVNHPNREVDPQENRIFLRKTYLTLLLSLLTAILFFAANNVRYMLLQAIVFLFICITAVFGRVIYKTNRPE